ncbi:MAG: DUF3854 domain-containing protein [Acidobacteriota bacterium]|nr:DUF3854 domain-containing protein [Acidobacteriota bacterium]
MQQLNEASLGVVCSEKGTAGNSASAYIATLLPQHQELIRGSAITDEVARARGYRSITTFAELKRLGFGQAQQQVPALLIPVWSVNGDIATYQLRPDHPRIKNGRPVKYETPRGARMVIDVPPHASKWLGDPTRPLFITEGARKADAGVSANLVCAALLGVNNFRGTNEYGGKTALADWEHIALEGRRVYIVYDSDVMTNPAVSKALVRLKLFLENRKADVFLIYLPPGERGEKVGLDDYLASGHTVADLLALASTEIRSSTIEDGLEKAYSETERGLVWRKETQQGTSFIQLTNFIARISADVIEDDGSETQRILEIEAWVAGQEHKVVRGTVTATEFNAMRWPVTLLGPRAIIFPNMIEHARCAVQSLSDNFCERRVYTHTGWREIDGEWGYIHAGGAISSGGTLNVNVKLAEALRPFDLPVSPTGDEEIEALRKTLEMIEVAAEQVTIPIVGAVWCSVLGNADFSHHLSGSTGRGKTALAALVQAYFGAGFDAGRLPGSWSSTGNSLEALSYVAKDAVLTVDDFKPEGAAPDVARLHRDADRLLRAQGNHAGRMRMRPDGTLRPAKFPRGIILSTGEDIPRGESLRARTIISEIDSETLNWTKLSACQRAACEGVYAAALAGFLRWLAPQYADMRGRAAREIADWRERATFQEKSHKRTPQAIGQLARGWHYFLMYTVETGALTPGEADTYMSRVWTALYEVAVRQAAYQSTQEPAQRFVELIQAAIASGRAHLADRGGEQPSDPHACGWQIDGGTMRARGQRIGWVDEQDVYLQPDAAYKVAKEMSVTDDLSITPNTLWKRLNEHGFLASIDKARETLKVRRTIEKRELRVFHLSTDQLL